MKQRLLSIDILRGLTIILMIIVNTPGTWNHVAAPLRHSAWNGLTLTDVVFPCFMFIMGITTYISLRKFNFSLSATLVRKVVRRSCILFLLGLLLNWMAAGFPGADEVRVLGVLQRFGICYLVVSLLACTVSRKTMAVIAAVLLVAYSVLLLTCNGYAYDETSILSVVDRSVLGGNMMNDGGIDPEGILSTIPSIAHVIIGYLVGAIALSDMPLKDKVLNMAQWGILMLFAGLLADSFLPINKKVWSASFVFVTCGLSLLTLVLFAMILDIDNRKMPKTVFLIFGVNPLVCYVLGELICIAQDQIKIYDVPLKHYFYWTFAGVMGDNSWSSFVAALAVAAIVGSVGWLLYAKKIYVKI